jgi:acyl-CoA hydrolase
MLNNKNAQTYEGYGSEIGYTVCVMGHDQSETLPIKTSSIIISVKKGEIRIKSLHSIYSVNHGPVFISK